MGYIIYVASFNYWPFTCSLVEGFFFLRFGVSMHRSQSVIGVLFVFVSSSYVSCLCFHLFLRSILDFLLFIFVSRFFLLLLFFGSPEDFSKEYEYNNCLDQCVAACNLEI